MTDILSTHPDHETFDLPELRAALDALAACAAACGTCSDSCLHGDHAAAMVRCIDLCTQCQVVCSATAQVLSRPGPNGDSWRAVVQACAAVCRECAEECVSHEMDHCQLCAEACRACAEACEALLAVAS